MVINGPRHCCAVKRRITAHAAFARYKKTAKGRAKRRELDEKRNKRQFRCGGRIMRARSVALAEHIRAHIRRRVSEFKQGQSSRAQVEDLSAL